MYIYTHPSAAEFETRTRGYFFVIIGFAVTLGVTIQTNQLAHLSEDPSLRFMHEESFWKAFLLQEALIDFLRKRLEKRKQTNQREITVGKMVWKQNRKSQRGHF